MERMDQNNEKKGLFATPKRIVIFIVCAVPLLIVIGVAVMLVLANVLIVKVSDAEAYAFTDAGVARENVRYSRAELEFERGKLIYEIEFEADGVEYDYWINAINGSVLKGEKEPEGTRGRNGAAGTGGDGVPGADGAAGTGGGASGADGAVGTGDGASGADGAAGTGGDGTTGTTSGQLTMDDAVEIALADAKVASGDVTYLEEELDTNQGDPRYDIVFYAGDTKYEYEVGVETGLIYSRKKEIGAQQPGSGAGTTSGQAESDAGLASGQPGSGTGTPSGQAESGTGAASGQPEGGTGAASGQPGSSAGVASGQPGSSAGTASGQSDGSTGTASGQPSSGAGTASGQPGSGTGAASGQPGSSAGTASGQSDGTSVDLEGAKSIAYADAGVSASEVTVVKDLQDYDNGILVYEIEFYTSSYEYDYEIAAATGEIRSKDIERLRGSGSGTDTGAGNGGTGSDDIGSDQAKAVAAEHAGFEVSELVFSKAELDRDNGYTVYEIEFYKDGLEYEYEINAVTGEILKYHSEKDR